MNFRRTLFWNPNRHKLLGFCLLCVVSMCVSGVLRKSCVDASAVNAVEEEEVPVIQHLQCCLLVCVRVWFGFVCVFVSPNWTLSRAALFPIRGEEREREREREQKSEIPISLLFISPFAETAAVSFQPFLLPRFSPYTAFAHPRHFSDLLCFPLCQAAAHNAVSLSHPIELG